MAMQPAEKTGVLPMLEARVLQKITMKAPQASMNIWMISVMERAFLPMIGRSSGNMPKTATAATVARKIQREAHCSGRKVLPMRVVVSP